MVFSKMLNNLFIFYFFKVVSVDLSVLNILFKKSIKINKKSILYFFWKLKRFNFKKKIKIFVKVARCVLKSSDSYSSNSYTRNSNLLHLRVKTSPMGSNKSSLGSFRKRKILISKTRDLLRFKSKIKTNPNLINTLKSSLNTDLYLNNFNTENRVSAKVIGLSNLHKLKGYRNFIERKGFRTLYKGVTSVDYSFFLKQKDKSSLFLSRKLSMRRRGVFFFKKFLQKKTKLKYFFLKTKSFFILSQAETHSPLLSSLKFNYLTRRTYNWAVTI